MSTTKTKTFFQEQIKFNLNQLRDAIPLDPMKTKCIQLKIENYLRTKRQQGIFTCSLVRN